jgi:cyanate permease
MSRSVGVVVAVAPVSRVYRHVGGLICNIASYFGIVVMLKSLPLFLVTLPLLGFFTIGVFSLFTIWLPEIFPMMQRALGSGFAFSFGRVLGAAGPSIVGMLAAMSGSYPLAITAVSLIYLVGLFCVKWAPETAHQVLQK